MRILFIERQPNFGGGSERVSLDLAHGLSKRGHDILLANAEDGSMLPAYKLFVHELWQDPFPLFGWRTLRRALQGVGRLGRFASSRKVDVVFTSDLFLLRTLAILNWRFGLPTVMHLGLGFGTRFWSQRWASRQVTAAATPSAHMREKLVAWGWPPDRLTLVPNWVDKNRFRPVEDIPALRESLGLPKGSKIVLYVGRLASEKGLEVLARAFCNLQSIHRDTHLVFVGGQQNSDYMATVREILSSVRDRVMEFGARIDPEKFYAAADVVVVPSICAESFGLTLVEAMFCGVLPLASGIGEMPNLFPPESRDLCIPPGDSKHLAEKLGYWLENTERRHQRASELRAYALERFRAEDSIDSYETILKNTCK